MSDSFLEIPEPSLPEHNLLRVVLNVHQQVRYGRWVERAWVTGNIVAACFVVLLVWNFRWTNQQKPQPQEQRQDTVQDDASPTYPTYISPGKNSDDDAAPAQPDAHGNSLPQGGPSIRREFIPEMLELNELIEKLQSRKHVLCGFLPYL